MIKHRMLTIGLALTLFDGCSSEPTSEVGPDGGVADASSVDANVPDANRDAGGTDAAVDDMSCSIKAGAGALVAVLHDADGAVVDSRLTDATGTARWEACPANAMVSVVALDLATGHRGVTIAGVQPGLHFELLLPKLGLLTTAAVDIPTDDAELSFLQVSAGSQCGTIGSKGATANLAVHKGCRGDDPTKLSFLATGRVGSVSYYSYANDVPVGAGGTTVVKTMSGWMTGPQVSASASNVPEGLGLEFTIQPMRNGKPFGALTQLATVTDGMAAASLPMTPSAFSSTKRVGVSVTTSLSARGIVRMSADPTAPFAFNLPTLLPQLAGVIVDNAEDARPRFAVETLDGTLIDTDLGIIRSRWTNADVTVTWQLFFPAATQSSIRFPALPGGLSSVVPSSATTTSVAAIDVTDATYAEILSRGYNVDVYLNSCAAISTASECWFTTLLTP
jgi:hypothetical protein